MSDAKIPDFVVEQLALGELPADRAREVREALQAAGDERLAQIEASNRVILEEHPPAAIAAAIGRRTEREDRARTAPSPLRWLVPVAVVATAILVWLVARPPAGPVGANDPIAIADPDADPGPEQIRIKGDARLVIHRESRGTVQTLANGDGVSAGDRLQVSLVPAGRSSGVVVSIDGAGVATLHFPATEDDATALPRSSTPLPTSYELDDAPGFERFFFVTGPKGDAVEVAPVLEAARRLASEPGAQTAPLPLPETWDQSSVLLRKP